MIDMMLAAAAVGTGFDLWGSRKARKAEKRAGQEYERRTFEDIKIARQSSQLANQEIDLRMKQEELAFEEDTLASIENLREVMAAQRAVFASQGRMPGVGSTLAIENRARSTFSSNEKSRKMSFDFSKHFLKSQQVLNNIGAEIGERSSMANLYATKSKIKASRDQRNIGVASRTFNRIPLNSLFGQKGGGLLSGISGIPS